MKYLYDLFRYSSRSRPRSSRSPLSGRRLSRLRRRVTSMCARGRELLVYRDRAQRRESEHRSAGLVHRYAGRPYADRYNSDSWKAKRIARGSPVIVWIGSASGRRLSAKRRSSATHRFTSDDRGDSEKYWLARMGLFGPKRAKFDSGQIITIRISPERDLPEGFQSQPGTPAPGLVRRGRQRPNPLTPFP